MSQSEQTTFQDLANTGGPPRYLPKMTMHSNTPQLQLFLSRQLGLCLLNEGALGMVSQYSVGSRLVNCVARSLRRQSFPSPSHPRPGASSTPIPGLSLRVVTATDSKHANTVRARENPRSRRDVPAVRSAGSETWSAVAPLVEAWAGVLARHWQQAPPMRDNRSSRSHDLSRCIG